MELLLTRGLEEGVTIIPNDSHRFLDGVGLWFCGGNGLFSGGLQCCYRLLEARYGLDVILLVVSAAVRPMLATARACAATAHSENGLGTSFVDGGALDVLAAVIIGGDDCF